MEEETLVQAVMRLMDGGNLPFLPFFALIRLGVS
jgi:hypothetical protein